MSTQVGTSSLPERLRWDAYAAMNASALVMDSKRVRLPSFHSTSIYAPDVSYTGHFGEKERLP